ncbi:MAG TPA: hypothetical protein VM286_10015 [Candidatus Thermoplasmatota archaeon]|nr:hypothetical protein [Candidatus Thermoplasmatota archaeon]
MVLWTAATIVVLTVGILDRADLGATRRLAGAASLALYMVAPPTLLFFVLPAAIRRSRTRAMAAGLQEGGLPVHSIEEDRSWSGGPSETTFVTPLGPATLMTGRSTWWLPPGEARSILLPNAGLRATARQEAGRLLAQRRSPQRSPAVHGATVEP